MNLDLLKLFAKNIEEQKQLKARAVELITPEMKQVDERVKLLKTEEAAMRPEVVKHLKKEEVDKYSAGFGTFSILPNKAWKYSEAVSALEKILEQTTKEFQERIMNMKKHEEETGTAQQIEGEPTLRFQAAKS